MNDGAGALFPDFAGSGAPDGGPGSKLRGWDTKALFP